MPLRVLIADDELLARKRLNRLLEGIDDVVVVGQCVNGKEVLDSVRDTEIDVVLLDIQMPKLTGVEALALMDPDGPVVVFTTAHADYAVEAFDAGAADYLLKPIEAARLKKALMRARERMSTQVDRIERLPISTRKGLILVDPADVSHALIDGDTVTVFTARGTFITDFRISDLEKRLPDSFERVHRKALLNLDHVDRLEPEDSGGYTAHTTAGEAVPVSRQAARKLRRLWKLPR